MLTFYSQNVWNSNPSWYRNTLVRSLVSNFDADVCLFQEFGPHSIRAGEKPLQNLLSDEYAEACSEFSHKNFTPVFYKKGKFDVAADGYFLYEGLNDSDSKSVTWAVLKDKASGVSFAAVSTHFWWKFDSENDNRQRLRNAEQLKEICDEITAEYNVPVIIGGDFNNGKNAEQGEEPYRKMLEIGFKDLRLVAESTTDSFTHHEYPVLNDDGTYGKGEMPVRNLDNLFLYGNFDVKIPRFDVITTDKALASSDHCPLVGYVEL